MVTAAWAALASPALSEFFSQFRLTQFFQGEGRWADLDGTTTRLVILAIKAATEVALWALPTGESPQI
jgi:hypothetical protein